MKRRTLLAAPLAAWLPVGKSDSHDARVKPAPGNTMLPGVARRPRGVIMEVRPPKGWQPTSWRDVPDGAFEVQYTYGPRSLAECRAIAKSANKELMAKGSRLWFIVAATDGRLPPRRKGVRG